MIELYKLYEAKKFDCFFAHESFDEIYGMDFLQRECENISLSRKPFVLDWHYYFLTKQVSDEQKQLLKEMLPKMKAMHEAGILDGRDIQ